MKITVDRIEGGLIVAELPNGEFADLPLCFAPDASEGDIINIDIDKAESDCRSKEMKSRLNALFKKQEDNHG